MDMRLELVPLPTSDVDRSKAFYAEGMGFVVDHDVEPGNGMRVVQLTPPGSGCSSDSSSHVVNRPRPPHAARRRAPPAPVRGCGARDRLGQGHAL